MAVPNTVIKTLVVEALHHSHTNTKRWGKKTPVASALLVFCPPLFPSSLPHLSHCVSTSASVPFLHSLSVPQPFFSNSCLSYNLHPFGAKDRKERGLGQGSTSAGRGVFMEKYPVIWVTSLFDAQGWNISAEQDCISPTHTERRCGCSGTTSLLLCRNTNHLHTKHIGHRDKQQRCLKKNCTLHNVQHSAAECSKVPFPL